MFCELSLAPRIFVSHGHVNSTHAHCLACCWQLACDIAIKQLVRTGSWVHRGIHRYITSTVRVNLRNVSCNGRKMAGLYLIYAHTWSFLPRIAPLDAIIVIFGYLQLCGMCGKNYKVQKHGWFTGSAAGPGIKSIHEESNTVSFVIHETII